ncbi:oocyte zinc finger protein XlCOF6-like [Stomoxys calcitrans]|uniref:oocyte zinc finger protein XlCOF6-like n=1 Tax=Stomoxys calcitrans TaxID=35570 RepID=UPI0027E2C734|nr:oocyte zinc finger protein XlCOF6-like [Stomoxys calcitrans]
MSSTTHLCRLCVNLSHDGSCIYNNEGQPNEFYNRICNYLPSKIVDLEKFKHISHICNECRHSLDEFCNFQQMVEKAQERLSQLFADTARMVEDCPIVEAIEDNLDIKVEKEFISESYQQVLAESRNDVQENFVPPVVIRENFNIKNTNLESKERDHQNAFEFFEIAKGDSSGTINGALELPVSYSKVEFNAAEVTEAAKETKQDDQLPIAPSPQEIQQPRCLSKAKFEREDDCTTFSDDEIPLAIRFARHKSATLKDAEPKSQEIKKTFSSLAKNNVELFDECFAQTMPFVKCALCPKLIGKYSLYREHFYKAHPKNRFHIICCSKKLGHPNIIKSHILNEHNTIHVPKCQYCGLKFLNEHSLKVHVSGRHSDVRPPTSKRNPNECFRCSVCSGVWKNRRYLQLHMAKEHPSQQPTISVEENLKIGRALVEELKCHDPKILDDLVRTWLPKIQCVVCAEVLHKYSEYRQHFQKTHPHKDFYLRCCYRKMEINKKVLDHMLYHNNPETFKCLPCNRTYACEANLRSHNRLYHTTIQERKFSCQHCSKTFTTRRGLAFHSLKHNSEPLIEPEVTMQNDGSSVYNCKDCDYSTQSYKLFSSHRWAWHTRRKSYTCQICGESFRLASMLRNHLDGHTGYTKKYTCSTCGSSHKNFTLLKAHKQAHHDQQGIESKFKRRLTHACSWCSEKFAYASCLKIHMKKVHPGKRMQKSRISCTLCPLKFSHPLHFRLHLRKKHGKTSLEIKEEFAEEDAEDSMEIGDEFKKSAEEQLLQ